MYVLGIELRSFGRAASVTSDHLCSPSHRHFLTQTYLQTEVSVREVLAEAPLWRSEDSFGCCLRLVSWGASRSRPRWLHGSFVCLQRWLASLHSHLAAVLVFSTCSGDLNLCHQGYMLVFLFISQTGFWCITQEEDRLRVFPCLSVVPCRRVVFHCLQNSVFIFF